ncbi:MAG TPA: LysR substrate-binding domain-containing protein [Caulobacteraceae bacterium]|nr:LysR substrate-binding domain-containing protein [Caulobacteraceae bacterium]
MQDLNDLYYFTAVVDHGGFAPAARALNLPKSSLSRRVARLEDRLGVRLIERSTRRFAVTEVGRQFHLHAQAAVTEAMAAEEAALQVTGEPRGVVRVSVPVTVAQGIMAEMIPAFLARYPKVKVHMVVTNRRVDLIEEGVDVAFRVRPSLDSDNALTVRILGDERTLLVASPAFVEQHGPPTAPHDLAHLPTLSNSEQAGRQTWRFTHADGRTASVEHDPVLRAGEFKVLVQAAIAGAGIAYLPEITCAQSLRTGSLVTVLPEWAPSGGIFHMVFTSRRGQLPAVSAFIDYMAANVRSVAPLNCDLSA